MEAEGSYRLYKSSQTVPTFIQMNPVQYFSPYFSKIYSNIILSSTHASSGIPKK
jgi:hypothetical protein